MILLILFIVLTVVGFYFRKKTTGPVGTIFDFITAVGIGALFLSVTFLLAIYIARPHVIDARQEDYKAIVYQMESGACSDEFGLRNKEIIDDVQRWNSSLMYTKEMSQNPWVSVFFPDTFPGLDVIDYNSFNDSRN